MDYDIVTKDSDAKLLVRHLSKHYMEQLTDQVIRSAKLLMKDGDISRLQALKIAVKIQHLRLMEEETQRKNSRP